MMLTTIFNRVRLTVVATIATMFMIAVAAPVHAQTFTIATVSPDGSVWLRELRKAAKEIKTRTEGRVTFKFRTGGVAGDDKTVLRKMRVNQLQGAVVTAGALAQSYPDLGLYSLPMVFRSFEEVDHVRASLDEPLIEGLRKKGYVSFGFSEIGFAYAMSKAPTTSVADARKQKVWIPDGDPWSEQAIDAFGIKPIPLPIVDVLTGLQTGLINAVAMPPVGALALQWHTQIDHVMDLPLLYVMGQMIISNRAWGKLSEADQVIVAEVLRKAVKATDTRSREDNRKAADVMRQRTAWLEPAPDETQQWRQAASGAVVRLVDQGLVPMDLYTEMRKLLDDYRADSSS